MTDCEAFQKRRHRCRSGIGRYLALSFGGPIFFGSGTVCHADPDADLAMSRVVHLVIVHDDGSNDVGYGLVVSSENKRMGIVTADHVLRGQSWNLKPVTVTVQFSNINQFGEHDQATNNNVTYSNITEMIDQKHDIGYFEITYDSEHDGYQFETSPQIQDRDTYEYVYDTAPFYVPTTKARYNSTNADELLYFDSIDVETGASGGVIFDVNGFAAVILQKIGSERVMAASMADVLKLLESGGFTFSKEGRRMLSYSDAQARGLEYVKTVQADQEKKRKGREGYGSDFN